MRTYLLAGMLLFSVAGACAQEMDLGFSPVTPRGQQVEYVTEPQVVRAGRESELELRFAVRTGYHVSSHTPRSELLIPTRLELNGNGVEVGSAAYPAGKAFKVGDESLDVYAGDFVVRVPVKAAAGSHTLEGTLRYQACDRAACFPPRTLPVRVVFEAK